MNFAKADTVEGVCWNMKLADRTRAIQRAKIDELFNGFPPYSPQEARQNNLQVNVNFLDPTKIANTASLQYQTALLSPTQYFTVKVDRGPQHKRSEWGEIITAELRKAMKRGRSSQRYIENIRSASAALVLHGIGPMAWVNQQDWCPSMQAIGDVMIPSRTLITMENLTYFAIYRRYTASQLYQFVSAQNVDPGWNKDVVGRCINWAKSQKQGNNSQSDLTYNPERIQEDFKENGFLWTTDQLPTVDCFDFYYLSDENNETGWRRRIVLDVPSMQEVNRENVKDLKTIIGSRGEYLYDSGTRVYADSLDKIIHWQFADGSTVAPFRYHSVRSLGFLLYSVCSIQNRLRCAMTESAFEALLQYFRVGNPQDAERAVKINLVNRGVIPDGVNFVRPEERWKVDFNTVQPVIQMNENSIAESSMGYNQNYGSDPSSKEKTATQVAAELNATSALSTAMLEQAYRYRIPQCMEIARRFCLSDSRDYDVKKFRASVLSQGVPESILNSDCWDISVDQIMGGGNRQLAVAQANMLLQNINLYDPDAQRVILRDYTFAVTGNASKTNELVPAQPVLVTSSVHDAELSAAALFSGVAMGLKQGVNHAEYAATLLKAQGEQIQKIQATGRPATVEEIAGLINIGGQTIEGQNIPGNGAVNHIQIVAQDDKSGPLVKQLQDGLSQNLNMVKAMSQQMQEAMQAGAEQGGSGAEEAAKAQAITMMAQVKAQASQASHQQKQQQRAESHQQKMAQNAQSAEVKNAIDLQKARVNTAAKDLETASSIRRQSQEQSTLDSQASGE